MAMLVITIWYNGRVMICTLWQLVTVCELEAMAHSVR